MDEPQEVTNRPDQAPLEAPAAIEPSPESPFWTGWDCVVLLAVGFFSFILAGTLLHALQRALPFLRVKFAAGSSSENLYFMLALQTLIYFFVLAFIYVLITRRYGLPFWHSLRLVRLSHREVRRFTGVGFVLAIAVGIVVSLFPSQVETPIEKFLKQGGGLFPFAAFAIVVAPFFEELVFRGFFYPVFERRAGSVVAVTLSALIFSSAHVQQLWGNWAAVVLIFVVGFVFSFIRAVTGRLTPCWVAHASYNSALFLASIASQVSPFLRTLMKEG